MSLGKFGSGNDRQNNFFFESTKDVKVFNDFDIFGNEMIIKEKQFIAAL